MATAPTLAPARSSTLQSPLALWHLLSLDAPTVAALWTAFIARSNHVHLPASSIAAMALAVWLLYASDRLLDARLLDARRRRREPLEARHHFHHRHRRAFLAGIAVAAMAIAALLPSLPAEAIHLYLVEGSFLAGYFLLIHATHGAHHLPKELAVGLFFAAATFIPTIARAPTLRVGLLLPALLLAALCSLNCLFIHAWEHPSPAAPETHPATRLALSHLHLLAMTVTITALAAASLNHQAPQIPVAVAVATLLLITLHHLRRTIPATTLRAAADLALLTPILFLAR